LHRDHLGNVTEVSDESGSASTVERRAYDVWGKRRNTDWTDASGQIFPAYTPRGFTGHEHRDDVGLVHMNGRAYDPVLGRMMSADPYVQFSSLDDAPAGDSAANADRPGESEGLGLTLPGLIRMSLNPGSAYYPSVHPTLGAGRQWGRRDQPKHLPLRAEFGCWGALLGA
jgi:RHS repeat-associated protein